MYNALQVEVLSGADENEGDLLETQVIADGGNDDDDDDDEEEELDVVFQDGEAVLGGTDGKCTRRRTRACALLFPSSSA